MTIEETIEQLELIKSTVEWDFPLDYQMAIDEAIEALKCVNLSAFKDGYEKGRKDALQMASINDGVYCWHTCCAWENCERCRRIGNGDIDYFAELQEERNYD